MRVLVLDSAHYIVYTGIMKNITLSAPEEAIRNARKRALKKGTTLNQEFRAWLDIEEQKSGEQHARQLKKLINDLSHVRSGGPFTRDAMNER